MPRPFAVALGAACIALAAPARAHVTLDSPQAPALSYVRLAIRVPHGCDGASTTGIRGRVTEGVTAVEPQAQPGWTRTIGHDETAAPGAGHDAARPSKR